MRYGTFYYDKSIGRYDIIFEDGSYYGGLSCGTGFEVFINNNWINTGIEYDHSTNEWYLSAKGLNDTRIDGLVVRI